MERTAEIARLWPWLPAFRVVAETQHLPTASRALHVTPSALSRTIRLLETELGRELFRRTGRRIELNDAGAQLLRHVRDAMRRVHSGVRLAQERGHEGAVHISTVGVLTPAVVEPALSALARSHPGLIPHLHAMPESELPAALLQGRLDIAFVTRMVRHADLKTRALGSFTSSVYCGPGHPLHDVSDPTRTQILAHGFAAPLPDSSGRTPEGWPEHVERHVTLHAGQMDVGIRACLRGAFLAVLPDAVGAAHGLRRLPFRGIKSAQMYVVHRPFVTPGGRAEIVLEAIVKHLGTRA